MNALKALELELSIAKSNERIYLNQIEKLNGYEYGVNYFDSRHKQEIEVDKKRFADKLKNTQSQIKRLHSIKQALTRPLDSEVEEALKRIAPYSRALRSELVDLYPNLSDKYLQNISDYLLIERALRLQPQRTKEEFIDEIIQRLRCQYSEENKMFYQEGEWGINLATNGYTSKIYIDWDNVALSLQEAKLIIDFFTEYGDTE